MISKSGIYEFNGMFYAIGKVVETEIDENDEYFELNDEDYCIRINLRNLSDLRKCEIDYVLKLYSHESEYDLSKGRFVVELDGCIYLSGHCEEEIDLRMKKSFDFIDLNYADVRDVAQSSIDYYFNRILGKMKKDYRSKAARRLCDLLAEEDFSEKFNPGLMPYIG